MIPSPSFNKQNYNKIEKHNNTSINGILTNHCFYKAAFY